MKWIVIMLLAAAVGSAAEFTRANDMVSDKTGKLQWQDNNASTSGRFAWDGAVAYCEKLELGGHDDWRLPSKEELLSIVDKKRKMPASSKAFVNVKTDFYWSSTQNPDNDTQAYVIHFSFGSGDYDYKYDDYRAMCVRSLP